jgi:hypothetical protein
VHIRATIATPNPKADPDARRGGSSMEITKYTKVSEILREYGDIADVMEVFGIKRVGRYSFRSFITRAITVERAAKIHHVPLDEFLDILRSAVGDGPDGPDGAPARKEATP